MSRVNLNIRPAVFSDALHIYEFGLKTLRAKNDPLCQTFTLKEVEHHLRNESKYCFVAVDSKNVIKGFVLAAKHFEENPQYGHIEWAAAKFGFGKYLARVARNVLLVDGVDLSICEVCASNTECINGVIAEGGKIFSTKFMCSEVKRGLVVLCEVIQTVNLFLVSNKVSLA